MADIASRVRDVSLALQSRALPAITRWERVEGIPRAHDFSRALRAEVRDALWMLSRQWQLGELTGDDAGSPVLAKLHIKTTRLTAYQPGDHPEQPFDDSEPLETRVEKRRLPFAAGAQPLALDVRLLMGRHWQKLLAKATLGYGPGFRDAFPVAAVNPLAAASAAICAHQEAWQYQSAFAGRAMDGYAWYRWLVDHPAPRPFSTLPPPLNIATGDEASLDALGDRFVAWFDALIDQPAESGEDAWQPSRFEYRFRCSAPRGTARTDLVASEYYHGELDWYSLDVDTSSAAPAPHPEVQAEIVRTFIPVAVEFAGMANARWWAFEDRKVNFGAIQPDTTEIAKLLLLEFGLIYSNDWCIVPVPLAAGVVAEVTGLAVTNVFGERLWIEPAGRAPEQTWQRWSMFSPHHVTPNPRSGSSALLMLPTVPKVQESDPLEVAVLVRDEMANMVWGVEDIVPLPHGLGRSGHGAAAETRSFFERLIAPPAATPLANEAKVRYEVMNRVPENWIPFIPVHVPGDNRQIQLQRASLPRRLEGDPTPGDKIKPRTALLREGLDRAEPYFVHEEEVPRSGVRVSQAFQRTRWTDGSVFVWLGARKRVGRGEGSSGLQFDQLPAKKGD